MTQSAAEHTETMMAILLRLAMGLISDIDFSGKEVSNPLAFSRITANSTRIFSRLSLPTGATVRRNGALVGGAALREEFQHFFVLLERRYQVCACDSRVPRAGGPLHHVLRQPEPALARARS